MVGVYLDMVVHIDTGFRPIGVFVAIGGKGLQGRFIDGEKKFTAGRIQLLEFTVVELF